MSIDQSEGTGQGHLHVEDLVKIYDPSSDVRAVDGVDLDIAPGEFVSLLGPSGCGKTTILRTIAGFEQPTQGRVWLDGKDITKVPPNRRPISMVFQSYALFPHLSVLDNIKYGLKAARIPRAEQGPRVSEALETMNLTDYQDRAPAQLSGGQQQRVALARAMVMRPAVMLFDEPLSNLDAALREHMRFEIRRLQRQLGTTAVYVTHDQSEAVAMSDRVVVLNHGKVEQIATPTEIYRRPRTRFVAGFVGRANFLPVQVASVEENAADITVLGRPLRVPAPPVAAFTDHDRNPEDESNEAGVNRHDAELLVRPESLALNPPPESDSAAAVILDGAVITATVFMGDRVEHELEWDGSRLLATVMDPAEHEILPEGTNVSLGVRADKSWLVPPGEAPTDSA